MVAATANGAGAAAIGQQQQQQLQESKPPIAIYPTSSVRDVAESIHLDRLSEETCQAVAGDVEYRLNLIVQEAAKLMRHARRTTLLPADVEHALKALNVQPTLQPAHPLYKPQFASVYPPNDVPAGQQQLYFLKDEEVDLAAYLKSSHVLPAAKARTAAAGGGGVKWKAHWLAVEGVQPLIPENPISQIAESSSTAAGLPASSSASALLGGTIASASAKATHQILAKAQLSQELQLLFTRITECLVPNPTVHAVIPETPSSVPATPGTPAALNSAASSSRSEFSQAEKARQAALATLSNDPSLGELLPYLIRWLTENVNNALTTSASSSAAAATHQQQQAGKGQRSKGKETTRSTTEIGYLLDGINAILSNEHLFVEPYLHQLLPAVLSVLLAENLHVELSVGDKAPSERGTKNIASDLLETLLKNFAGEYDSLLPRVSRVLVRALQEPGRSPTRYSGAVLGIQALGKQAVKASLLGNKADLLRHLSEKGDGEQQETLNLALDILADALDAREDVDAMEEEEDTGDDELREKLGDALSSRLISRPRLRAAILGAMQGM